MSDDRALYDASMKLLEFVIKADTLIYLLTSRDLTKLNSNQIESLKEYLENDSLDCLADVSHGFPVFAEHSGLVRLPVEPLELSYPDESCGTVNPEDLMGTSYHHAAVNFVWFHCIGTNFWQVDSKGTFRELPPKFDIDTLRYGLEMERMRVFKSIIMESPPGERIGIFRTRKETPESESVLTYEKNFSLINYNGKTYRLSPFRAACFRVMWENQVAGKQPMRDEDIIFKADPNKDSSRLRDVFKGQPIYGKVIIDVPGMPGHRQLIHF
tara:strand:- start:74 stop:880 length:807 start_codon:yes stop_codon:yes gene_type:complete